MFPCMYVEPELIAAVDEISDGLQDVKILVQGKHESLPENMQLWDPKFGASSDEAIPRSQRAGIHWNSPSAYIYTSGTTGIYCGMKLGLLCTLYISQYIVTCQRSGVSSENHPPPERADQTNQPYSILSL